jgi:YVTN family beta-propeller protein
VTPFATATNTPGMPIGVPIALGVALAPNGRTLYATSNTGSSGSVIPIDTATGTPGAAISNVPNPVAIAITPDGTTAYVVNANESANGSVTPINLATGSPGTPITVGKDPEGIAITPDGKTAYVANDNTSGSVTPIDLATGTPGTSIPVGMDPIGVAITPDGKTAYVADAGDSTVTPIDTATNIAGTPIDVGSSDGGIAMTPDQAPVAAFSATAAAPGSPSTFDGSTSSTAVGSIASYDWNFGDGQSAVTTTPLTSHSYASPGTYTARLTVTNTAGTSLTQVFTGQTMSLDGGPEASTTHTITIAAPKSPAPTVTQVAQTHALWREGHALATLSRRRTRRPPLTRSLTLVS